MVNFIFFDLVLLVLFVIFVSIFLYTRKSNLEREGLLYLYRTKLGIKFIDYIGGKYQKTLKVLSYVSITTGYFLMASMLYLAYSLVKIYIFRPDVVSAIKVPPITPLVPYIDKVVPGLPSFFFTYWIIILAIIAITHEFAHGIFMRRYNIKIKSTGFGFFPFFLPIFLAAFVEQDEKSMNEKKNFEQMAVLSAGTFANVLTSILFFAILIGFFSFAFTPAGVNFDNYQYSSIAISNIISINNVLVSNPSYDQILELTNNENPTLVRTNNNTFFATMDMINNSINKGFIEKENKIILFDDAPAVISGLSGAIQEINGVEINSLEKLSEELSKYSPGAKATIKTSQGSYEIIFAEHPDIVNRAYLGVGFANNEREGVIGKLVDKIASFKKPHMNYEPRFELSEFVSNLLWWIVLISISVALFNMLPVGIFDGGKFFYLTILSLTKKKKWAEKSYKYMTYLFLLILIALMVLWVISFI